VRSSYRSVTSALHAVIVPFIVTRFGVLVVGLIAAVAIGYDPPPNESASWRIAADPVRNLLARWDTFWYLDIATRGYHWTGNALQQQNVVFFPLYPFLMRSVGGALGHHPLVAGLVVSLVAFLGALVYFWRWTAAQLDEETATAATAMLCAFPFSVYFSAVYTESLFLLTIVGALYHLGRGQFAMVAVWGMLAGLTRPNGFLLACPLAWIVLARRARNPPMPWTAVVAVVAPVAGMLVHSAYLKFTVGDAFAWIADQAAWPTITPWPLTSHPVVTAESTWDVAIHVGNFASIALAFASLVPVTRLLGGAYSVFVLLNIVPPIARHGLLSLGRFTSVMFPIFVWLASASSPTRRRAIIVTFAVGQAIAAALFFSWRPLV